MEDVPSHAKSTAPKGSLPEVQVSPYPAPTNNQHRQSPCDANPSLPPFVLINCWDRNTHLVNKLHQPILFLLGQPFNDVGHVRGFRRVEDEDEGREGLGLNERRRERDENDEGEGVRERLVGFLPRRRKMGMG